MRRTLTIVITGLLLLAITGCTTRKYTHWRTLGAIEADPSSYNGKLISFTGTVRDVVINQNGMNLLVVTGLYDDQYFRVQYPSLGPSIIRGDHVRVLGRVRQTAGVVGLGDRLTRTVQIDAISLAGPNDAYRLNSEAALVDQWHAGEMVVLP